MPFASALRPSIQCGLLKAVLVRAGHEVDVHYLNVDLAARLSGRIYSGLSDHRRNDLLLGEWLFAVAAFGAEAPDEVEAYRRAVGGVTDAFANVGLDWTQLRELRDRRLPSLADEWATAIDWGRYQLVGFTSTFEQNVASLALARRLKSRHPSLVTVFGGANLDGDMGPELVRCFDQIDYAVVGEGDRAVVDLAAAVAQGVPALEIPGVVGRRDGEPVQAKRAANVERLDELPDPDYDDYFAAIFARDAAAITNSTELVLPFESARGCWWGQKHHCTFCGLNGDTMRFRAKSPQRVIDELGRLSDRYKLLTFEAVDNIMDMHYLDGVLRPLSEQPWDYAIFYEVKANLQRAHLRLMARAGVTAIQPGIESLSTQVLRLMRKGTTVLDNVRVLKWARHYGISAGWNLIMGFPGETVADYERQWDLIPLLYHLQPPAGAGPIWLERFSPYFTDATLGFRRRSAKPAYGHVYPARVDVERVAYFFDYDYHGRLPDSVFRDTAARVDEWRDRWAAPRPPTLVYQRSPDWLQLFDTRGGTPAAWSLSGDEAAAYEQCGDRERTPTHVAAALADAGRMLTDPDKVRAVLDGFCERGLMISEDDRYLALALPVRKG